MSYTEPINPSSVEHKLNRAQAWAYMELKVRYASRFVDAIVETEVLSESISYDGALEI